MKLLLVGRPGIGKTTVARRLVERLREAGVPLAGFTTEEIRHRGRRVGFAVENVSGERAVLAHVDLPGPPRVGRYGVDGAAFERIAVSSLAEPAGVVVIDELGKMELSSSAFRDAVGTLFERDATVVATVHAYRDPFTDGLTRRPDVELIRVTDRTREELPALLADRLLRLG